MAHILLFLAVIGMGICCATDPLTQRLMDDLAGEEDEDE